MKRIKLFNNKLDKLKYMNNNCKNLDKKFNRRIKNYNFLRKIKKILKKCLILDKKNI